ncbi:hypothetical protein AAVH_42934, partial [Aphelenchoides avenae]
MFSINASYAVNGDVKAVYSSVLWFDNVVGHKVSTLVNAMLEERPIDDPHATFVVFRRLASLRNTATNGYGWSACDIDDMLSPHCEYRVEFEVQPAEEVDQARSTANDTVDCSSQSELPLGDEWNGTFDHLTSFFHDVVKIEPQLDPEANFLSNDRSSSEDSFCYGSGSDNGFATSLRRGKRLGDAPGTFEATPPNPDTDNSCETCGRDLSVPFSEEDDALSAAATDATYSVRLKTPQATRPKELDRLRSLKHEFDRVSELVASSAAIVAGEARFWDGVMWASAISDGTSLSAENRRCLR